MRYKNKKVYAWSDAIAYSVGLIASDGCLSSDRRHVILTSIDIEQINNFCIAIDKAPKVTTQYDYRGNRAYRVQLSDVSYYDFLLKAGLTPKKSKTIGRLYIPNKYYSHFLRGVFDGDGTTYAYYDKRWKNSYLYYMGFAGASKPFLEYLAAKNSEIVHTNGMSIRKSSRAYVLSYGKQDSNKLYKSIYGNSCFLFLSRKRLKLESFILHDKNDIILPNARVL